MDWRQCTTTTSNWPDPYLFVWTNSYKYTVSFQSVLGSVCYYNRHLYHPYTIMQKLAVLLKYIQVISVFITAMLFLKSSQVFLFIYLFIYLFFNESATQSYILIAATTMNWLQLNNWRGEDKGASLPPPFLYSEPSISPLKSVFWLAQTLC